MPAAIIIAAEGTGSPPQQSSVQASPSAVGEWEFKSQTPARTSTATMTIKKNSEGKYEGTWSTQWGESTLSDITFENGKMKFVHTSGIGGQEMKTTYDGTVVSSKITGKGHNQFGEFAFEGTLQGEAKKGADAIVGEWQMNVTAPARAFIEKLTITKNADGTLAGKWESQIGENIISNIKFEAGKLTFTRINKIGDRKFMLRFAGIVEGDSIKGTFSVSGEHGEREANATRITSAKANVGKKAEPSQPVPE
jgi:hypothetical protein